MMSDWDYTEIILDRKQPEQLYYQLARELDRQIVCRKLAGQLLPSAREMARQLNVNPITVKKAYEELLRKKLIEKKSAYQYQAALRKKDSGKEPFPCIGIILPFRFSALISNKSCIGAFPYIKGIIDSAMEHKISTVMLELPDFNASRQEIDAYNESLTKRLVGLVHIGGRDHYPDYPLEAVLNNKNLPQVFISGIPMMQNVGIVMSDKISGITALAEQLRALNHHRVGIISRFSRESKRSDGYFCYSENDRPDCIRNVLEDYGLDCDDRYHCFNCDSYQIMLKKLKEKKKSGNLPTVYCCYNDFAARYCIRALTELEIKVPEEISVIGFDGLMDDNDELTTIGQPFYAIGHHSVDQLLDYYENGISERNRISYLKTFLITGKTLGEANHQTYKEFI
ncbi:MAG: substrate-binding domain-containing protein [Lentisphaeria bacterium]|nr:substrate-binding domain-containing protein [Lentisphaeria bacterium]